MTRCESTLSGDDAFSPKETGDGFLNATTYDCDFTHPKDDGINAKEYGDGDLSLTVSDTKVLMSEPNNSDVGDDGIQAYEDDGGDLWFVMKDSSLVDGSDNFGVKLREFNDGKSTFNIFDSKIDGSDDWALWLITSKEGSSGWSNIINSDLDNDGCWILSSLFNPILSWTRLNVIDCDDVGPINIRGSARQDPDDPEEVLVDNYLTIDDSGTVPYTFAPYDSWWVSVDGEVVHNGGPVP